VDWTTKDDVYSYAALQDCLDRSAFFDLVSPLSANVAMVRLLVASGMLVGYWMM